MYATPIRETIATSQLTAASTLQDLVPELVSLSLNSKQVHWNVTGPAFLPIHELTDGIAKDTGGWADLIAERAMALGYTVDARPGTVTAASAQVLPGGRLREREALIALVELIDGVAMTTRSAIDVLERTDPVGNELAIEVLHGLERYRWMLRAQLAGHDNFPGQLPAWAPLTAVSQ